MNVADAIYTIDTIGNIAAIGFVSVTVTARITICIDAAIVNRGGTFSIQNNVFISAPSRYDEFSGGREGRGIVIDNIFHLDITRQRVSGKTDSAF
ncbi:MAG: hypothetical protein HDS69_04245 [Bacteroidales bacterium]|nr:hypothetical protein [Bacteroidales bacterium]MBD5258215.1 hypothetical protein [Barnesiella sp.]